MSFFHRIGSFVENVKVKHLYCKFNFLIELVPIFSKQSTARTSLNLAKFAKQASYASVSLALQTLLVSGCDHMI